MHEQDKNAIIFTIVLMFALICAVIVTMCKP